MKKLLLFAAFTWVSVGLSASARWSPAAGPSNARTPAAVTSALAQAPTPAPAARAAAPAPQVNAAATHRQWLNKYCVTCHNSRTPVPAAEPVNLETADVTNVLASAETWERVLRKLAVRAMPPQGMPHPTEPEYAAFTSWLAGSLDRASAARNNPGRYIAHRLNRTEYGNAVRDLLDIEVDVTGLLPSDGGNFGFDNIAASLTTSPLLLERYLTAAQRISAYAVGDAAATPGASEQLISLETTQKGHVEGLPLGTRGGAVVRHIFPADGEYEVSGRLNRGVEEGYTGMEGHETPHMFVITIDGELVFSTWIGGPQDHLLNGKDVNKARVALEERMKGRVFVTAGPHDVGFTWKERPTQEQAVWQPPLRDSQEVHMVAGLPRLRSVGIQGPFNVTGISDTPSRRRLFVCKPTSAADEGACAERILSSVARRAYRRPVTAVDLEAPQAFYLQARQGGGDFDAGIRAGLARILASPSFLYRVEKDPETLRAGAAHRITDLELASRLSFFLWSSIPDEDLLKLAETNRLRAPGVLEAQVKRMVADPRADAMMTNFTGQWLQLRNLESRVTPDLLLFPDFDDNVRKAFRKETELFFGYVVRQNRSALELLNADYTFVNERLAKHYGIPGVYGSRFRLVQIPDANRRGLLGHGSVLSLTSVATRTSPVLRGKFILATFLNTPPPPPPPSVPTLEESKGTAEKPRTVRQQMEAHRANPVCASCHRVIDPVGFALENFNPVGQWRAASEDGQTIDTSGVLADGSPVNGPAALRNAILSRPAAFTTILTERMMTYALGRGVEPTDMAVVRRIVTASARDNYRFMSIITGIVQSAPFQMRTKLADPAGDRIALRADGAR